MGGHGERCQKDNPIRTWRYELSLSSTKIWAATVGLNFLFSTILWNVLLCFFSTAHKAYFILALGCFSSVTPRHSFTSIDTNCVPGPELDTGDIKAGNLLQSALSLQTSLQARRGLLLLFHAFAPGGFAFKIPFHLCLPIELLPLYHLWQLSPKASPKQCKCLLIFTLCVCVSI